jgi:hypothetical protein
MPGAVLWNLAPAEVLTIALGLVLVVLLALMGYRAWLGSRITPEERERRRREALASLGKMGDATLVEVQENVLFYSYDVRGVEYLASQDVATLSEYLPSELPVGTPIMVRYDPRNPANSIIVAERWTGLRESKVG